MGNEIAPQKRFGQVHNGSLHTNDIFCKENVGFKRTLLPECKWLQNERTKLTYWYLRHQCRRRQRSRRRPAELGELAPGQEVLEGRRHTHVIGPEEAAPAEADLQVVDVVGAPGGRGRGHVAGVGVAHPAQVEVWPHLGRGRGTRCRRSLWWRSWPSGTGTRVLLMLGCHRLLVRVSTDAASIRIPSTAAKRARNVNNSARVRRRRPR